jgi:hypothetical protein
MLLMSEGVLQLVADRGHRRAIAEPPFAPPDAVCIGAATFG